jgi:hypothetical protein
MVPWRRSTGIMEVDAEDVEDGPAAAQLGAAVELGSGRLG